MFSSSLRAWRFDALCLNTHLILNYLSNLIDLNIFILNFSLNQSFSNLKMLFLIDIDIRIFLSPIHDRLFLTDC